eukprot:1789666-Rhodomonas_salina.2
MASGKMRVFGPNKESFVKCDCGCGESQPASSFYYRLVRCSKGGGRVVFGLPRERSPSQEFLDRFHLEPLVVKGGKGKKKQDAASKAPTPVKDAPQEHGDGVPKKEGKKDEQEQARKLDTTWTSSKDTEEETPQSSFALFAQSKRDASRGKAGEDLDEENGRQLGKKWAKLSQEQRAEWDKKFEKVALRSKRTEEASSQDGARNSFSIFVDENRGAFCAEKEEDTRLEAFAAERWGKLSEEEKSSFAAKARDRAPSDSIAV